MASSCNNSNNCPCCNKPTARSPDAVFLTIWYKWDREQERGAGRWCDDIGDAFARFVQFRKDDKIRAALIDRDNKAIMSWDIEWVDEEEQPPNAPALTPATKIKKGKKNRKPQK